MKDLEMKGSLKHTEQIQPPVLIMQNTKKILASPLLQAVNTLHA